MKFLHLSNFSYPAVVDDEDYEKVRHHRWWADKRRKLFYVRGYVDGKMVYLHRFITGQRVNLRDGNGFNCLRENLIPVTNQQNCWGFQTKRGNTSKFRGVSWFKRDGCWRAYLVRDGKQIHLGYFEDETEAAFAYDLAARKYFGKFAAPNFK